LVKEVEAICTREFHNKLMDDRDRKKCIELETMPQSPSDVVFIWHYRMKFPRHKLGDGHNGNHYSFLEYNEKRKPKLYHDSFTLRHSPPEEIFFNLYSPDGSKTDNKDKLIGDNSDQNHASVNEECKEYQITSPNTSRKTPTNTPTKTTNSEQVSPKHANQSHTKTPAKQNEKRRKELPLENIFMETENEMRGKESAVTNKKNDGAMVDINPPSGKINESDDEMILYDLPPIISVPVSSGMRDEMSIGKSEKYLFFETKDNDGKGNCFYNSILNSNAFGPGSKIDCDYDNDSLLAL
jgi:hypothetical protein